LGDIITAIDGKKTESSNDLYLILEKYKVGDVVSVTMLRNGKPAQARVTLEEVR
jgi:S1-C subfamily serine protease